MKEQNQKTMAKATFGTIVLATVLIIPVGGIKLL